MNFSFLHEVLENSILQASNKCKFREQMKTEELVNW